MLDIWGKLIDWERSRKINRKNCFFGGKRGNLGNRREMKKKISEGSVFVKIIVEVGFEKYRLRE